MTEPTFGVVVFTSDVETIVNNLLEIEYPADKVKFHIVSKADNPEAKMIAIDQLKHKFRHSLLTMNLVDQETHQIETQAFREVYNAKYFVMLEEGQKLDPLFLRKVADSELIGNESIIYKDSSCAALDSRLVIKNYLDYADFKIMQESLEKEISVCYLNEK